MAINRHERRPATSRGVSTPRVEKQPAPKVNPPLRPGFTALRITGGLPDALRGMYYLG